MKDCMETSDRHGEQRAWIERVVQGQVRRWFKCFGFVHCPRKALGSRCPSVVGELCRVVDLRGCSRLEESIRRPPLKLPSRLRTAVCDTVRSMLSRSGWLKWTAILIQGLGSVVEKDSVGVAPSWRDGRLVWAEEDAAPSARIVHGRAVGMRNRRSAGPQWRRHDRGATEQGNSLPRQRDLLLTGPTIDECANGRRMERRER